MKQNNRHRHFGFWEKKYRGMELGNESLLFWRIEWFHIHIKIAFFHLSAWLTAVDASSIAGSLQLSQTRKSGVGQKIAKFCCL